MTRPTRPAAIALVAIALCGAAAVWWATARGIGTSPDSGVYIAVARSVASGHGIVDPRTGPLTHFPPGYPAALAALGVAGIDPLVGARALNAGLFALLVLLTGGFAAVVAETAGVGVAVAAFVAFTPSMVELGAMAWSEPLALVLGFAGLALVVDAADRDSDREFLAAGCCLALSLLTRYASVAFWMAAVAGVLLWRHRSVGRRLRAAAWVTLIPAVLLGAWCVRSAMLAGSATDRQLAWHPMSAARLHDGLRVIGQWLVLSPKLASIAPAAGALALLALALAAWRWRHDRPPAPFILLLFCSAYLVFLLASMTLFDAATELDARILAPVLLAGAILAGRALKGRARQAWLVAAVVGLLIVKARYTWYWTQAAHELGLGYANHVWRNSALLPALPTTGRVYSNAPQAPYLITGRIALELPRKYSSTSLRPNDRYDAMLAGIEQEARVEPVYIAYFTTWATPPFLPTEAELRERLPLRTVAVTSGGTLYQVGRGGPEPRDGSHAMDRSVPEPVGR